MNLMDFGVSDVWYWHKFKAISIEKMMIHRKKWDNNGAVSTNQKGSWGHNHPFYGNIMEILGYNQQYGIHAFSPQFLASLIGLTFGTQKILRTLNLGVPYSQTKPYGEKVG